MSLEIINREDDSDLDAVTTRFYWHSIFDEAPPDNSNCLVLYHLGYGSCFIEAKVYHDGIFYPRLNPTEHLDAVAFTVIDGYADLLLGSFSRGGEILE